MNPAAGKARVGFLVGPTAAGKSALSLELAQRLGAEIINADSRQVYRGMNIGTAKPAPADRRRVPHHLVDLRDPAQPLEVATFARIARATIDEITTRGKPVLVVGGSGLYLRAIRGGICAAPPASGELRARLTELAAREGIPMLHRRLREVDPASAERISQNDLRRIVRGLEVYELTGLPLSEHQRRHRFAEHPFDSLTIGITLGREQLYQAIDRRFEAMVAAGLIDEVRSLMAAGYDPSAPPLRTIGYREIAAFLRGELTLAEAIVRAKRESRRLAKRQLTWFGAEPDIVWLEADNAVEAAFALFRKFFQSNPTVAEPTAGSQPAW